MLINTVALDQNEYMRNLLRTALGGVNQLRSGRKVSDTGTGTGTGIHLWRPIADPIYDNVYITIANIRNSDATGDHLC